MNDRSTLKLLNDQTKLAVLREAIDRADALAAMQARMIEQQEEMLEMLRTKVRALESENRELRGAL